MQIKIVSLNVWIGGILFDSCCAYLDEEQADIYMLQEVYDGKGESLPPQYRTLSELQERLHMPFVHFAPSFIDDIEGQEIVQGNAILSKYPLREISITYYDVPFGKRDNSRSAFHVTPRNLQHVVAQCGGSDLHILNTQGIWGEDGGDSPRRIQMAEHIVHEVGTHTPLVLAGDFNVQEQTDTIALVEKKLKNVFSGELKTTFNIKRKDLVKYPGFASAVCDMFFVTSDIQVLSHSCPQVDISDHYPLVVQLEI